MNRDGNADHPKAAEPMLGSSPLHMTPDTSRCDHVMLRGNLFVRIRNVDAIEPFFMSVVSSSDVWLYVGSNAAFTAGRVDPDHALFPYETVDHILRDPDFAGAVTTLLVGRDGADATLGALASERASLSYSSGISTNTPAEPRSFSKR